MALEVFPRSAAKTPLGCCLALDEPVNAYVADLPHLLTLSGRKVADNRKDLGCERITTVEGACMTCKLCAVPQRWLQQP